MNRISMCGIILALCAIGTAQDLNQKITIDIPAARAKEVLAKLGQAAGVQMEPAANLRDEVFVVHAVNSTVQEIMDKIAQAESGRWSLQSGTYLLIRDSSTSVAQERSELRQRAAALSAAIAKMNETVKKQPVFDETAAQKLSDENKRISEQFNQAASSGRPPTGMRMSVDLTATPTGRAIARLLANMDVNKLAQIGMNQRVVFSTQPTNMQLPIGSGGTNAFRSFIEEQALYSRVHNAQQTADGGNRVMVFNGFSSPNMGSGDAKLGLGIGLVVVQRRFGDALSIDIVAADPKWDTISSGSYNLAPEQPAQKKVENTNEKPLEISADSKEMAKALGGGGGAVAGGPVMVRAINFTGSGSGGSFAVSSIGGGDENLKLSPELRAKILQPEKFDPLGFVPGDAMLSLGKDRGKCLVALLPDGCFTSMTRQFASDVTASQLLASLEAMHGLQSKEENGWIVITPLRPYDGRGGKVDRANLGKLLRTMDKEKGIRLDDVAAFAAASNKVPGINDIDMIYPRFIDASTTNTSLSPMAFGSFPMYKFYSTLTQIERQSFGSGQQIRLGSLTQQQLALVSDMLYNSPQGPQVQVPQQQRESQERTMTFTAVQGAGGLSAPMILGGGLSVKTERTIVLPNGVPADGFMMGSVNQDQVAQGMNSQTGSRAFLDAGSLAFNKSAQTRSELASFTPPEYDKYRMAKQTNFGIRFLFTPQVSMMRSLTDTSPDGSEFGTYDALPADFRKKVDEMAENLKNAFGKVPAGGRSNPPPP